MVEILSAEMNTTGGAKYNRYYNKLTGSRLDDNAFHCATFVTYGMTEAGVPRESVKPYAGCTEETNWFISQGRYMPRGAYTPLMGDVIFLDWDSSGDSDHTGVVEKVASGYVHTLEGNTGNRGSNQRRKYLLSDVQIRGYGVPLYNWKNQTEKPVSYTVKVTAADGLNVRSGAGTGFPVTKILSYDTSVEITAEKSNWGRTKEGWICLDYTVRLEVKDEYYRSLADVKAKAPWWHDELEECLKRGIIAGDGKTELGKKTYSELMAAVFALRAVKSEHE